MTGEPTGDGCGTPRLPTERVTGARPAPPAPAPPLSEVVTGSRLDHALTCYREQTALRRLVGLLAVPALAALTGFGLLVDPGPVPWFVAALTFLAAAEAITMSQRLRRARRPASPAGGRRH